VNETPPRDGPGAPPAGGPGYHKLNPDQRAQLIEWVNEDKLNRVIKRLIDEERKKGVLHGGEPWPEVKDPVISYYRRTHSASEESRAELYTTAQQTGLARRERYIRRLIEHITDLEEQLRFNTEAILVLIDEGVLDGVAYPVPEDSPDVLEAESYTVDGQRRGKSLDVRPRPLIRVEGDPNKDPRYVRYLDLQSANTRHYQNLERLFRLLGQAAHLLDSVAQTEKQQSAAQVEQREQLKKKLEDLLTRREPDPVPVPRKP
jgi:hypothetical protein